MRSAFIDTLAEAAASNPSITLITGDLGYGVLTDFANRFPRQFINAGVAEQNMTALACGLALEGRKVFTYSIANFATLRCLEQIRNDICYHDVDVTVVAVGGGYSYGQLGHSHFATEDVAILRSLPGIKIFTPSDSWETEHVIKYLVAEKGPAYVRLDRVGAPTPVSESEVFEFGRARVLTQGNEVAIFAFGSIVSEAIKAQQELREIGIGARVISVHTMKPLDGDCVVRASTECLGILCLEEHAAFGGLATAVADVCMDAGLRPTFFIRVGLPDSFPEVVGDQQFLRHLTGIDANAIATAVRRAVQNIPK